MHESAEIMIEKHVSHTKTKRRIFNIFFLILLGISVLGFFLPIIKTGSDQISYNISIMDLISMKIYEFQLLINPRASAAGLSKSVKVLRNLSTSLVSFNFATFFIVISAMFTITAVIETINKLFNSTKTAKALFLKVGLSIGILLFAFGLIYLCKVTGQLYDDVSWDMSLIQKQGGTVPTPILTFGIGGYALMFSQLLYMLIGYFTRKSLNI